MNRHSHLMNNHSHFSDLKMPLFFKLWFAFVGTLVLLVFFSIGVVFYTAATNPAKIGQFVGEIVSGYKTKINE